MSNKINIHIQQQAISALELGNYISELNNNHSIGAYNIFIGQVRNDHTENGAVRGIEYTSYTEMAESQLNTIAENISTQYDLEKLIIVHSLGYIKAGEMCLLVIAAGGHRKACNEACQQTVEKIKKDVPIWGKEVINEENYQWKVNKF